MKARGAVSSTPARKKRVLKSKSFLIFYAFPLTLLCEHRREARIQHFPERCGVVRACLKVLGVLHSPLQRLRNNRENILAPSCFFRNFKKQGALMQA